MFNFARGRGLKKGLLQCLHWPSLKKKVTDFPVPAAGMIIPGWGEFGY
jgi:hypothetical protein